MAAPGSFCPALGRAASSGPGPHLHKDTPQAAQRRLQTEGGLGGTAGSAAVPAAAGRATGRSGLESTR